MLPKCLLSLIHQVLLVAGSHIFSLIIFSASFVTLATKVKAQNIPPLLPPKQPFPDVPFPRLEKESPIETIPSPPPPIPELPINNDVRLKIKDFDFRDNTVFNNQQLKTVIANYQGKDLTVSDLYQITRDIQQYYEQAGYVTSYASG
jgi:hemolysin activation/secretion protein